MKLRVTKRNGEYVLEVQGWNNELVSRTITFTRQAMVEFINWNWPVGTRVQWFVRP